MLQFQYVDESKLNSRKVQIGRRFETLAAQAQATW
jgi:hypothetical protein